MKFYLIIAAGIAALLTFTHIYVYNAGKAAVHAELLSSRITILKDGQAIDKEVLAADDAALCELLGGCVLPDIK